MSAQALPAPRESGSYPASTNVLPRFVARPAVIGIARRGPIVWDLGMPRAGRRWRLMVLRGSILGPAPCLLGRGSYDSRPNREGVAARQVAPSVGGPLQLSWSGARQRSPGRLRRLETPPHKCHRWTISSGQQHRHMLQFGRIQRERGNSG